METATLTAQIFGIIAAILVVIAQLTPTWKGNTVLSKAFEIIESVIALIIPNFVKEETTDGKPKITTKSPNLLVGVVSFFKNRKAKRKARKSK